MLSPLAILLYEDLLPGSQLVNRLQDLKYRVQVVTPTDDLPELASTTGPLFILVDLVSKRWDICELIRKVRANPATAHVPIIAFADETEETLPAAAKTAGATLVVTDAAITAHLVQFLEQALQVE